MKIICALLLVIAVANDINDETFNKCLYEKECSAMETAGDTSIILEANICI